MRYVNQYLKIIWAAVVLLLAVQGCTEVELCYEGEHPHRTGVVYDYEWEQDIRRPDTMAIVAIRVVNLWKCGMNIMTDDNRGFYFYNEPKAPLPDWAEPDQVKYKKEHPDPEPEPDPHSGEIEEPITPPADDPVPEPVKAERDTFSVFALREGSYKFFTVNVDSTELRMNALYEYMEKVSDEMQVTEISAEYRTYMKGQEGFKGFERNLMDSLLMDWTDRNPQFPYIQTDITPLYYDTLEIRNIYMDRMNTVTFRPRKRTQQIDFYIDIDKSESDVAFAVDSLVAEVSGIPLKMYLVSGYIDLQHTGRIMFGTTIEDAQGQPAVDTYSKGHVLLHGRIDVPTIVSSNDAADVTGPGIMQLIVKASAEDGGVVKSKKFQRKLNLFKALREADLIEYTEDNQHAMAKKPAGVINISFKLKGNEIVNNSESTGGLDEWIVVDPEPSEDIEL